MMSAKIRQYATCTSPIMHLKLMSPKILHNFCFSYLLGSTAVPRENENNAYAKFGGGARVGLANKVHYGRCASGL